MGSDRCEAQAVVVRPENVKRLNELLLETRSIPKFPALIPPGEAEVHTQIAIFGNVQQRDPRNFLKLRPSNLQTSGPQIGALSRSLFDLTNRCLSAMPSRRRSSTNNEGLDATNVNTPISYLDRISRRVLDFDDANSFSLAETMVYLKRNLGESWLRMNNLSRTRLSNDSRSLYAFVSGDGHGGFDELIKILQGNLLVAPMDDLPVSQFSSLSCFTSQKSLTRQFNLPGWPSSLSPYSRQVS